MYSSRYPFPKGTLTLTIISTLSQQPVPDLTVLQTISKLMILRGKLAELENLPEEAIDDYGMVIKFGKHMDQSLLINRLVGIVIRNNGSQAMIDLLTKPESVSVAKKAFAKMQELDQPPLFDLNSVQDYEPGLRVQDIPADILKIIDPTGTKLTIDTNPIITKYNVGYAKQELAYLAAALRVYQSNNQKMPEKLESLVPDLLHSIPQDPFSNAPFIYAKQGEDYVLYSIGPDMTDDRAQINYDAIKDTTKGGDIVAHLAIH